MSNSTSDIPDLKSLPEIAGPHDIIKSSCNLGMSHFTTSGGLLKVQEVTQDLCVWGGSYDFKRPPEIILKVPLVIFVL